MKKLFLLVSIVVLTISCTKEEEYVDPLIELAETAKADSIAMIEFMNTHKLIIDNEGEYENNINWKVEEITDNDAEDVQSLFDIMGANRIDWVYGGITFNVYYYQVNEGTGINPASSDVIRVDYNAYDLPNKLVDNSVSSVRFTLSSLIGGWQLSPFCSGLFPWPSACCWHVFRGVIDWTLPTKKQTT